MQKLSEILKMAGLTPKIVNVSNNCIMTIFDEQDQAQQAHDLLKEEVESVFTKQEIQCVEMNRWPEGFYEVEVYLNIMFPRVMWEDYKA